MSYQHVDPYQERACWALTISSKSRTTLYFYTEPTLDTAGAKPPFEGQVASRSQNVLAEVTQKDLNNFCHD